MIIAAFRTICGALVILGLLWIYTFYFGGPLVPFFSWLSQFTPQSIHIMPATPLKPVIGS